MRDPAELSGSAHASGSIPLCREDGLTNMTKPRRRRPPRRSAGFDLLIALIVLLAPFVHAAFPPRKIALWDALGLDAYQAALER